MARDSLDGFADRFQGIAEKQGAANVHMTGANLLLAINGVIMGILAVILACAIINGCGDVLDIIDLYDDEVAAIGSILFIVFGICYVCAAAMPVVYTVMNIIAPSKGTVGAAWRAGIVFVVFAIAMWAGSEIFDEPSLMGDSLSGILFLSFGGYGRLLGHTLVPGLVALVFTSAAFYLSGATSTHDYANALNPKAGTAVDFREAFTRRDDSGRDQSR